jgi:hypothetical protein
VEIATVHLMEHQGVARLLDGPQMSSLGLTGNVDHPVFPLICQSHQNR